VSTFNKQEIVREREREMDREQMSCEKVQGKRAQQVFLMIFSFLFSEGAI
jgi:hypothetical protein